MKNADHQPALRRSRIPTQTMFPKEDRMKKQNFTALKLAIFFAMAATMALSAHAQQLSPEELRAQDEWRVSISQVPAPKAGCFQAEYPKVEWHEIACTRPTNPSDGPERGAPASHGG